MTIIEAILNKLAETEKVLTSLYADAETRKQRDNVSRKIFDAINFVRGAAQMAREFAGSPEVAREGYSLADGTGNGRKKTLVERHESYGVITASKPMGLVRLVGATTDALPSCVELRVYRARRELDQELHTEYYYPDNLTPTLTVRMSVYQWAELISSMSGVQVPCTLTSLQGVTFDRVPEETRTPLEHIMDQTRKEGVEMTEGAELGYLAALAELDTKIDEMGLSKKRADELKVLVGGLRSRVSAPKQAAAWASQRIAEDTERSVAQARIEMNAAFQGLVLRAGMQAVEGRLAEAIVSQLGQGKKDV
jgi:hypothetical protein